MSIEELLYEKIELLSATVQKLALDMKESHHELSSAIKAHVAAHEGYMTALKECMDMYDIRIKNRGPIVAWIAAGIGLCSMLITVYALLD